MQNVLISCSFWVGVCQCSASSLGVRAAGCPVRRFAATEAGMLEATVFEDTPAVVPITATRCIGVLGSLALISFPELRAEGSRMGR